MYRHLFNQIVEFVGVSGAETVIWAVPLAVLGALLILASRGWKGKISKLEESTSLWALLALFLIDGLKVTVGVTAVLFLSAMLLVQAGLFGEKHGRVTSRNSDAVRSKWGCSQEQRELEVEHFVWEDETTESFAGGGHRKTSRPAEKPAENDDESETLSDEIFEPILDEKGKIQNPGQITRRMKIRSRSPVPQDSVTGAIIDLDIKSSPRYLGGAGYPGYENDCNYRYTVQNRSGKETRAHFSFPLPGNGYGLFDRLEVKVDGEKLSDELDYRNGRLMWWQSMQPRQKAHVEVHYASRGLEYFRYWPGNMRSQYLVSMRLRGIDPRQLNFPIGSMSPADDLKRLSGNDYALHWDLSRAVTNFSIGVIMPRPTQPGFAVARIIKDAPTGLIMMALVLGITHRLLGMKIGLTGISLAALMHYLGYIAFAQVSELTDSFPVAFAGGMLLPTALGVCFWLISMGRNLPGIQSAALQAIFGLGYPLAVYFTDYTGVVLNTFYVILTGYLMLLAARALGENQGRTSAVTAE